jgi:hypothetical protein
MELKLSFNYYKYNLGLKKELSDAGSYSYAAICAISLHELFGAEYDMPYSKDCIKKFVKHLELPKQVR